MEQELTSIIERLADRITVTEIEPDMKLKKSEYLEILEASGFGRSTEPIESSERGFDFGTATKSFAAAVSVVLDRVENGAICGMTIMGDHGVGKSSALAYLAYKVLEIESRGRMAYEIRRLAKFVTADNLAILGAVAKSEEVIGTKHLFIDDLLDLTPAKKEVIRSAFNDRERRKLNTFVSTTMRLEEIKAIYPLVYDRMKFFPFIDCYSFGMKSRRKPILQD